MELKHVVENYYVASWHDFKNLIERTYGNRIYFKALEEGDWSSRYPRSLSVRMATLQDEDREDLSRLVEAGDTHKAEVDNPLDLVATDLCNRGALLPGKYLLWK